MGIETTGLVVAILGYSVASILVQWLDHRGRQKEWEKQRKAYELKERYLVDQLSALRAIILEGERRRIARELKHAEWRRMAGPNQDAAQALIDVDIVTENSSTLQRLLAEEERVQRELENLGAASLLTEIMGDPYDPKGSWEMRSDKKH